VGWGRETVNRKRKLSAVFFTTDTKSFIHVTRIAAMHIIFTRTGCNLFTCDMYMCRLRHINDSVFSSLKMEGLRLILFECFFLLFILNQSVSVLVTSLLSLENILPLLSWSVVCL
jgi:hypothetical protein